MTFVHGQRPPAMNVTDAHYGAAVRLRAWIVCTKPT
jgi:hypothetical protein